LSPYASFFCSFIFLRSQEIIMKFRNHVNDIGLKLLAIQSLRPPLQTASNFQILSVSGIKLLNFSEPKPYFFFVKSIRKSKSFVIGHVLNEIMK